MPTIRNKPIHLHKKKKPTFIDLFCGCGGFSLGMKKAGFSEIASVDFYPEAMSVFRTNLPRVRHAIEHDITEFPPEEMAQIIGVKHVDVVLGGPPCQGFSKTRQVDGANSGNRYVKDERRHLYREFFKYVNYFHPKIFVMENVPGIRSAAGGKFFTRIQVEARMLGYRVHADVIRAWEYGVPQKRERQLVIGTRIDMPIFSTQIYMTPTHGKPKQEAKEVLRKGTVSKGTILEPLVTLWEAIGDLPPLRAGGGKQQTDYDPNRRRRHLSRYGSRYLLDVLQLNRAKYLTGHEARPHNDRDLRDFNRLREGENSAQVIERGQLMEFPYDKENFEDRYTRQHRNRLCSTIVAHMSKDGLMFIHPTQNRSLTPREAARVQSFPDWFQFPVTRMHQFRMIGNAVPPLVGKAVGLGIVRWLAMAKVNNSRKCLKPLPKNEKEAIYWLLPLILATECGSLKKVSPNEFRKGWFAVGFLNSQLHPDSAMANGKKLVGLKSEIALVNKMAPHLIRPAYAQSGWPKKLVPVVEEAHRRFIKGELSYDQYYFSEAQFAGSRWLRKKRGTNGTGPIKS